MTRSDTESKKAPRGPAVPDALATAPSSRSGRAQSTRSRSPATEGTVGDGHRCGRRQHDPGGGEVVGRDAGAAEVGADGLETLLEALPPATIEHGRQGIGRPAQIPASRWTARRRPRHRGNSRWWPASGDTSSTALGSRDTSQAPTSGGEVGSSAPWKVRTGAVTDERSMPGLELARHVVDQPLAAAEHARLQPLDEGLDGPRHLAELAATDVTGRLQDVLARDVGGQRIGDEVGRHLGGQLAGRHLPGSSANARAPGPERQRRARHPRRPPPAGSCATSPIPATRSPSAVAAASAHSPPADQPTSRTRR